MTPREHREHQEREKKEFTERVLEVNRVTRVVKGGKRMRFRAVVIIGDENGRVSYGAGKATDVSTAVTKAVADAKKRVINVVRKDHSIPYAVSGSYGAAKILLKPAAAGTGIIAGGAMRVVLQLAGIKDAVGKALGSQNKMSNAVATIEALSKLVSHQDLLKSRGVVFKPSVVKSSVTPEVAVKPTGTKKPKLKKNKVE